MTKTDLSTEALLVRREIAEKATPGQWEPDEPYIKVITGDDPTDYVFLAWICPKSGEMGTHEQKANDAAHIAANSPDVVIDTIDELLRLRAENGRLKEGLENALHVNELRLAEVAKTLFTGIVEGISGGSESVMVQAGATCVHCNARFTSAEEAIAHDKVCPKHPATIRAERLENEADWLAENCWKKTGCEYIPTKDERGGMWCDECPHEHDCRKCWREAARKAVEEA